MKTIVEKLRVMGACDGPGDAIPWVLSRPWSRQTIAALWEDCPRADWMLWLARRCNCDAEEMRAVAWACAHLAQAYAAAADGHRATLAADDAADYAVAFDAHGAVVAPRSAFAATRAAASAARAAYAAAAYSARDAAADGHRATLAALHVAYDAAQKDCADMVRLLVTCPELP